MRWINRLKYNPRLNRSARLPIVFILVSLFSPSIKAQQTKNIEGQVFSNDGDVAGTHVMNITTQKATITDVDGFFTISVKLNDTLIFSAIQYRRKLLIINSKILESRWINIYLEEGEIKLEEVSITPYNLTGDLIKDLDSLEISPIVSASTLKLLNANVKVLTQNQRKLYTARTWDFRGTSIKLDPLINYFSGRTKMLKNWIEGDKFCENMQKIRGFFIDSLFIRELGVPKDRISDFMYFCEIDPEFQTTIDTHDRFKIWEFMKQKSPLYRKNNEMD